MEKDKLAIQQQATSLIEELEEKKTQGLIAQNRKTQYIKEKVFKYADKWWEAWQEMMDSEDKNDRKVALAEYNKLQAKILPTEITGADGENLIVKIVNFGQNEITINNNQEHNDIEDAEYNERIKPIDGEIETYGNERDKHSV
jgi:hypothetical protein